MFLDYSTTDARNIKENMLTASRGNNGSVISHLFTFEWPLFWRGSESFKEHNYLSFVSRAKLRTLTVKQGSSPPLFPFPSFSLTPFITCNAIIKVKKRAFFSAYCCSHTQSTFINKGRRQAGSLIKGIVLKFNHSIKRIANLSRSHKSLSTVYDWALR